MWCSHGEARSGSISRPRAVPRCWVLAASLFIAGCDQRKQAPESASAWKPADDLGSLAIRLQERWRQDLSETVDGFGGAAVWDDGVIWIGERRSERIWELAREDRDPRLIREGSGRAGGTLAMDFVPERGMLVLGRNGVTFYGDPKDTGVFREMHRAGARGFDAFPNGDYVVAYGQYPDDPHVDYAFHRYDLAGNHIASWHPAFSDESWRRVTEFSGGPVAVAANGDLIHSEPAPFRITRYSGGMGHRAEVVIDDPNIISSSEFQRAMPEPGVFAFEWSHSVFVDEMPDGSILNVARVYQENRREADTHWMVISPDGELLGRTTFRGYLWVATASGPGTYLVVKDRAIIELDVSMVQPP